MIPNDPRLDALQRYADGVSTREDVATVEAAILDDEDFRKLALEYLHLDSAMREFGAVNDDTSVVTPTPAARARWQFAAAAAAAVAVGLSLWHWWPTRTSPPQIDVEIIQLADAKVGGANQGIQPHARLRSDSLELRSGEAHLRLASDVKLTMSGPSEVRFVDSMHARVLHGKVTVDCGARGRGFILDTPVTRVVDLSTQFGVEARADGATDVMVIKGHVELVNPRETQQAAPLEQGEAVRVNANQALARIVNITGGLQPGEWSTQPPPRECNIVSVSDNFGATEGYHFYRIVPGGLRPGAVVYSNRNYVWRAPDQGFPASLLNADVVQTFFGELKHPAYAIEITVARPVELFVLMPRRGLAQGWLTENFTRTGEEVLLDESASPTAPPPHLHFDVWKRTVSQAGKVTLGPGNRDSAGNPTGMYGIAARALSP